MPWHLRRLAGRYEEMAGGTRRELSVNEGRLQCMQCGGAAPFGEEDACREVTASVLEFSQLRFLSKPCLTGCLMLDNLIQPL